jgi:uncharacterized membrane protein (Fun14 family)
MGQLLKPPNLSIRKIMALSILTITVFLLVLTVLSLTSGVLTIGKKEQQDLSRRAYGQ